MSVSALFDLPAVAEAIAAYNASILEVGGIDPEIAGTPDDPAFVLGMEFSDRLFDLLGSETAVDAVLEAIAP